MTKIDTSRRQVLVVVVSVSLILIGIPNVANSLTIFDSWSYDDMELAPATYEMIPELIFGLAFIISGIGLLCKSRLIRNILRK